STAGAVSKAGLASSGTGRGATHADSRFTRDECQMRPRLTSRSVVNQISSPFPDTDGDRSVAVGELRSVTSAGAPQGSSGVSRRDTQMSLVPDAARVEEK